MDKVPELRLHIRIKNNLIIRRAESMWGRGISQSEMARKIGVHQTVIGSFLNMKRSPVTAAEKNNLPVLDSPSLFWTKTAVKIAIALRCVPEDIFPKSLWEAKKTVHQIEITREQAEYMSLNKRIPTNMGLEARQISQMVGLLPPREKMVIEMRYGVNGKNEYSVEAIAKHLGLSYQRVHQIKARALGRMNANERSEAWKRFS